MVTLLMNFKKEELKNCIYIYNRRNERRLKSKEGKLIKPQLAVVQQYSNNTTPKISHD